VVLHVVTSSFAPLSFLACSITEMTMKYAIYLTTDNSLVDTLPGYANPVVSGESTQNMYDILDTVEVDDAIVVIEDKEDIDCILQRHRARKIACGNYLLKRNITLVMTKEQLAYTKEKWKRMIDDKSVRMLE
jgi:hypothetical protein